MQRDDNDDYEELELPQIQKTVQLATVSRMKGPPSAYKTQNKPMSSPPFPSSPSPPPRPEHNAASTRYVSRENYMGLTFLTFVSLFFCVAVVTFVSHDQLVHLFGANSQNTLTPTWRRHPSYASAINTTSVHATRQSMSRSELIDVRRELITELATTKHMQSLLCMHHLMHPRNMTRVRVCTLYNEDMQQFYFMLNLRLTGYDKSPESVVDVRQTSIACAAPITRKRSSLVYAEWEDERQHTHYMAIRGDMAHMIQLYVEEFVGNKHCVQL